jgi:hypothetical protein
MKTVPPLNDLFNMAGLNLPTYLAMTNLKKLNQLLQKKSIHLLKSKNNFFYNLETPNASCIWGFLF